MEKLRNTLEGALDTIIWFEKSITELEVQSGELMKFLEENRIPRERFFELFKIFSQLRFHLTEAEEYQSLLQNISSVRQSLRNNKTGREPAPKRVGKAAASLTPLRGNRASTTGRAKSRAASG